MTNTITANNLKPSSMIFLSIQHVLVMYAGAEPYRVCRRLFYLS